MDNDTLQSITAQLGKSLVCGNCKSARLLIWDRAELDMPFSAMAQQQGVQTEECVYAVHCDYFRRRVESPDHLHHCGAHQKKGKGG